MKFNKKQRLPTFNQKITVLNKIKATHSTTRLDVWKKTTLDSCFFNAQAVRNINGTTVTMGNNFICRVPKNDNYRPYNKWIEDLEGFTFSTGDYIVKGEVTEDLITPDNIRKVVEKYKPNAFEVRFFKDNTGIIAFLEHYHLEGV
ncbi:MAG: hypothetical protein K2L15_04895 [Eubacteriales bacterium]|nr:hypothetical protein [Eubacteriales bacterium]